MAARMVERQEGSRGEAEGGEGEREDEKRGCSGLERRWEGRGERALQAEEEEEEEEEEEREERGEKEDETEKKVRRATKSNSTRTSNRARTELA
eukprot:2951580-Rhodomonas_salina.1